MTMLEALSASFASNFLWIAACVLVVSMTKIAVDIFGKRSTRKILKEAESLQIEREEELRRRIEQANRRLRSDNHRKGIRAVPNQRLLH